MRTVDELIESGLKVIQSGYIHGASYMVPLLSGGHDSMCACHLASQHERFTRDAHHIDTGIGAEYTRQFVERLCANQGWRLVVYKSPVTFRKFVERYGFPGPGCHGWVYNRLKDRCVRQMVRGRSSKLLITGCRSQESVRRMGHVSPIQVGEWTVVKCKRCRAARRLTGECPFGECKKRRVSLKRIWCAPCHDWSKAEQQLYMDEFGLPTNHLKIAIGLSGECFCGAFAQAGEIDLIRRHAPDVAEEIDTLADIARAAGKPCQWGTRPQKGRIVVAATGPLCSSCDQRLAACGVELEHGA